ncbi:MAG: hypothetical protein ACOY45_12370 [Pseudomonadota bacterium]
MMATEMGPANIGEQTERRRRRSGAMLIAMALVAAAIQLATAWANHAAPGGAAPAWLTVASAASVGGLLFVLFRMGDRITDEFKKRQINTVAVTMMKALMIGYPSWQLLRIGGLVPDMSAQTLFMAQAVVMLVTLLWCRLSR